MSEYPKVTISTDFGDITAELWSDVAPKHVENFLKLGREGFYDNLAFHRVISGFVIQGGCPRGDGTGGPGYELQAEFNDRQHVPGTLSMARSADPDSAGSQFFICLSRAGTARLDGHYCAFGSTVEGADVIRRIASVELADVAAGRPVEPPLILTAELQPAPPRRLGEPRGAGPAGEEAHEVELAAPPARIPR